MNRSPWIDQLDDTVHFDPISGDITTQKLIIGGGIAGVCTTFFILKHTDFSVTLLEAGRIGHGASGHNAGQVVQYFEKSFSQMTREYGVDMAVDAQKSVFYGWELLEILLSEIGHSVLFESFLGYSGVKSLEQLVNHLENKYIRDEHGVQFDGILIDKNWDEKHKIPLQYRELVEEVDREFIAQKTESNEYFPILLVSKKGCINSALLCQRLIKYIQSTFSNRLTILEKSPADEIRFVPDKKPEVVVGSYRIIADDIILCTNGFENLTIIDLYEHNSKQTNHDFHKHIEGLVGYMAGYKTTYKAPTAISYFVPELGDSAGSESYYYLTRRTIKNGTSSLVCVGGPDLFLTNTNQYIVESHDPKEAYSDIRQFLTKYRTDTLPKELDYQWHGLMGFTKSGQRYIGKHPKTPHLWYNLGCNGVGILTSIYGGWKTAQLQKGTEFTPSVFDPR